VSAQYASTTNSLVTQEPIPNKYVWHVGGVRIQSTTVALHHFTEANGQILTIHKDHDAYIVNADIG
jgi:hypothetical protein